ncbi:hypothetical protein H3Z85_06815 [Chryseobacterium indologenes]|uniref:hypothetical protein n=1 Tax=Chryseobacterium indologenes TaxID=253 RepID=UPI0003E06088|nr:hypothetical protein [Chryseobacterium indologenes]QPQ53086.1 hypothetical protein H3Z85_06815 [Chryseobacterium indologenes]GAE66236.1 hypothetical protein CIN01S_14_01110 [Chryseobacterium indologenes NBRC 14944]SFK27585.1 hypothetical protein SAMN05421692_3944 [Chryseobacterium indologenes]SUX51875.1 Uncharacterised protein [Chryseobacterium indologenes]
MSKKKLLIHEVFNKAREDSQRDTKNGLSSYLWLYFKEDLGFDINDKSFGRYYDAFIKDQGDINIQPDRLNVMSRYLGYKDFAEFSRTFVKKEDDSNKTTVKITVDEDEESISEKFSKLIINITNEQHFKMPEFIKQNGLGIMEITFLICLVTGNVLFSNNKKVNHNQYSALSFMSEMKPNIEKKYMYWNGERYIATDSSYINPGIDIVAMNEHKFQYFKKIMRKDTLTDLNAVGKTWYSKYNNEVEFFTDDGIDPDNGRELRKSTSLIIFKYAGKQKDTIELE